MKTTNGDRTMRRTYRTEDQFGETLRYDHWVDVLKAVQSCRAFSFVVVMSYRYGILYEEGVISKKGFRLINAAASRPYGWISLAEVLKEEH